MPQWKKKSDGLWRIVGHKELQINQTVREGRFDLKLHLTKCNQEEMQELLTLYLKPRCEAGFYVDDGKSLQWEVCNELIKTKLFRADEYTPVQLIQFCNQYKNPIDLIHFLVAP